MKKHLLILASWSLLSVASFAQTFKSNTAEISFISKTDFETFQAISNQASAAVSSEGKVQFRVPINSFIFEKKLMQTHFQENYMESAKYPNGSFKGTIVYPEKFILNNKQQEVKVKGVFNIHGVEKNTEVTGTIQNTAEGVKIVANFSVILSDYKIAVPSNVMTKISQNIDIKVNALLNAN
jgi:polyisoprenoid-binding protein YceI